MTGNGRAERIKNLFFFPFSALIDVAIVPFKSVPRDPSARRRNKPNWL